MEAWIVWLLCAAMVPLAWPLGRLSWRHVASPQAPRRRSLAIGVLCLFFAIGTCFVWVPGTLDGTMRCAGRGCSEHYALATQPSAFWWAWGMWYGATVLMLGFGIGDLLEFRCGPHPARK